jgi:hypothetical protein
MPRCDQGPRGSAETENTAHESDEDGVEIYGRAYARLRTRAGRLGKGRADPAQGEACRPRGVPGTALHGVPSELCNAYGQRLLRIGD